MMEVNPSISNSIRRWLTKEAEKSYKVGTFSSAANNFQPRPERLGLGATPLPTSDRSLTMSKIKKDIHKRLKHTSHTGEQVVNKVWSNDQDCDTGSRSLAVHGRLNMRTTDSGVVGIKKKRKRKKHKGNVNEDSASSLTKEDDLPSSTASDGMPFDNAVCLPEKRDLIKFKKWRTTRLRYGPHLPQANCGKLRWRSVLLNRYLRK